MFKRYRRNCRKPSLQVLETRRVLAASFGWDGPGQGSADLTYYIANSPTSLSPGDVEAAIETALDAWSDAADITFRQVDTPGLRDSIDISFKRIDGQAGTLAQAYFPDDINPARIAGDVQFDIAENWEVGNALGRAAFDLTWVATHEIGHALGLDHSGAVNSILAPFVSASQVFAGLSAEDIAAIGELYAPASSPGIAGPAVVDDELGERFWERVSPADADEDQSITFQEFDDWLASGEANLSGVTHRHQHHIGHHRVVDAVLAGLGRRDREKSGETPEIWRRFRLNFATMSVAKETHAC